MPIPETISGLGSRNSIIHAVSDAQRRGLSAEEARLVAVVGAGVTVDAAIRNSGLSEPRAIAMLLALRLRGIINPGPARPAGFGANPPAAAPARQVPPVPSAAAVRGVPGGAPRPKAPPAVPAEAERTAPPPVVRPTAPAFTPIPTVSRPTGPTSIDVAALSEKVDLDDARKREILDFELRCRNEDHFAVLGIAPGADGATAKKAFYELSRRFHPDRFFGKEIGSFRNRIERIFRRLNEAQAVLADPDRRRAWLAEHPGFAGPPASPPRAPQAEPAAAPSRSQPAARASAEPAPRTAPPAQPAPAPAPAPRSPEDEKRAAERRARLARHPFMAKHARVHEAVARARKFLEQGECGRAQSELGMAAQLDPNNKTVAELMAAAKKGDAGKRAEADYAAAKSAEALGDLARAIGLYRSALALAPDKAEWAHHFAKLLLRGGEAELKEAHPHARRAAELAPDNADFRLTFAEVLTRAGLGKNASREYEAVLKLRPDDATAKERLKSLKWKL